jgi:voltage-gated potassium channel Kch
LTILASGDTIKLVGLATEFKRIRAASGRNTLLRRVARTLWPLNPLRFIKAVWRDTATEVRAAFVAVSSIAFLSCFVFAYALDLNPLDAIYFVLTTMTTVGYGDITPKEGPTWALVLGCFLMLDGVVWMVLMYVLVTDYLVSARLEQASRRGGPDEGHTVVVGVGDVGLRTTEDLVGAKLPVVVVDADGDARNFRTAVRKSPAIVGDARDLDVLHRARVRNADSVVATTGDDAVNLSIGVAARSINPRIRVVLRIVDADFALKLSSSQALDRLISPAARTSPSFVGAALFPGAITSFVHNGQLISLLQRPPTGDEAGIDVEGLRFTVCFKPLQDATAGKYYEV